MHKTTIASPFLFFQTCITDENNKLMLRYHAASKILGLTASASFCVEWCPFRLVCWCVKIIGLKSFQHWISYGPPAAWQSYLPDLINIDFFYVEPRKYFAFFSVVRKSLFQIWQRVWARDGIFEHAIAWKGVEKCEYQDRSYCKGKWRIYWTRLCMKQLLYYINSYAY